MFKPSLLFRLYHFVKNQRVQLIHANGTLAFLAGFLVARAARIPIVRWLVDMPQGRDLNENISGKLKADLIICNSQATNNAFHQAYPKNASPCEVIYPSIEIPSKKVPPNEIPSLKESLLGLKNNPPVILSAGRFQKWKGQHILIHSIPDILKKVSEAFFVFAGDSLPGMDDGSLQQAKELAIQLGVSAHCRFLGFRNDVSDLMEISDLVIHTSLNPEPFGLVIPEAMAHSKVVVATDQGGPKEIIENQVNGYLITPGHPEILAQTIIAVLENPALREKVGAAGKISATKQFNAEALAKKMENLYRKVLGK